MTYARAHLVDAENGGIYHCISRCVRRSWLCGHDPVSGQCFEHRRAWIESRLLELSDIFAVDLYGYAVMSNHYHVVLEVAPRRVSEWSDDEVARRWCSLGPHRDEDEAQRRAYALVSSPERMALARERLGSLSWFMRYLNESLARIANREDGVSGRFWEGRFKSIALLDEAALVACMAYVDLNPVRAKITSEVDQSTHTSISRRAREAESDDESLVPLSAVGLTLSDYRSLLEWTASAQTGAPTELPHGAERSLSKLGHDSNDWLARVTAQRFKYRAYGALTRLRDYTESLGQRWLWGTSMKLTPSGWSAVAR